MYVVTLPLHQFGPHKDTQRATCVMRRDGMGSTIVRAANADDEQDEHFSNFGNNLKNSAGRLTRMAAQGNKIAVLKLSGILCGVIFVLWLISGFFRKG